MHLSCFHSYDRQISFHGKSLKAQNFFFCLSVKNTFAIFTVFSIITANLLFVCKLQAAQFLKYFFN